MQPYLESLPIYTDRAPPWTSTNRGHGITSRPLKHDLGNLTQRSQGLTHWHGPNFLNQSNKFGMHKHNLCTYTSHTISHNSPLSYSEPNHANSLFSNPEYRTLSHIITMPYRYQPLSCLMPNSCQTYHLNFMNHLIHISYSHHVKTHKS